MLRIRLIATLLTSVLVYSHAQADEGSNSIVNSVVIGALAHNLHPDSNDADGIDANLEIRFNLPLNIPESFDLMPTVGGTVNFDDGASTGYLGATLRYQHQSGIYLEGFTGLAVHSADTPVDAEEANLGCDVLFRNGGELGYAWAHHQLGAQISHLSHGGVLCSDDNNDGLTQLGVRYGYRF